MGRKRISKERDTEICKEIIEILKQNLKKDICLCNLIEEIFSKTFKYLNKIFKRYMHETILQYHDKILISHACKLLKNYDCFYVTIELGFNDESYFCNWFKKKLCLTPSIYRIKKHNLQVNITTKSC